MGEKIISEWLLINNFTFIPQHKFNECKNKRELPFDFYLTDYNICIEYDGVLHYKDKFNNAEEFKETKKRDKIKTNYCKDNNITLLRIPYWDFNNIEEILREAFYEKRPFLFKKKGG